jgi:hypothetical protein
VTKARAAPLLVLAFCACAGHPQSLPVSVSICDAVQNAHGFNVIATIKNDSTKPISAIDLTTVFYQDFRYQRFSASAHLNNELDPGDKRGIIFTIVDAASARVHGNAMRCYVTHLGYLDGTSQDAPPS